MHELSLCDGLLDLIRDQQGKNPFERVRKVIVEIGALGHVDAHALAFAFEAAARNTPAEHADLEIREIPGRAWCLDCATAVALERRGDGCQRCGSHALIVEQGEELRLKALEVI